MSAPTRFGAWLRADDVNRLVREIDVALNGADAAPQASLCDIAGQVCKVSREGGPILPRLAASPKPAGAAPLPDRDIGGRIVREAWMRWALTQACPKPSWLVPYDDLPEADKEADRQIFEACAARATGGGGAVLDAALRERGLPTVGAALSYSRNYAEAAPHLTQTGKDHILGLCNMLEIAAPLHQPPAEPAGKCSWCGELVSTGAVIPDGRWVCSADCHILLKRGEDKAAPAAVVHHTDAGVDGLQSEMVKRGFVVPVRVISEAMLAVMAAAQQPAGKADVLGRCCYGGRKPKSACASCAAWKPEPDSKYPVVAWCDSTDPEKVANVALGRGSFGCEVPLIYAGVSSAADAELIERFRIAARALIGIRQLPAPEGQQRPVYAEDVETMADVLRVLEGLAQQPPVSNTTAALIDMLRQRDAVGRAKYGKTLDRTDLSQAEWLQHMAEEMLDGAGYALAAIRTINNKGT